MQEASKVVFALNNLIEINDQRLSLYKGLAEKSKEIELKLVYMQYAIQAQTFTVTLNKWKYAYGGTTNIPRKPSLIDSAINQVKKAFSTNGKQGDLKQCELLENNALKMYKTAMALSFLPAPTLEDIEEQTRELEKAQLTLKSFRENGATQWQMAFI